MICEANIKKSNKRGLWQIKEEDHNLISLQDMHDLIEKCLFMKGFDFTDRSKVYKMIYADEPLDNGFLLKRIDNKYYLSGEIPGSATIINDVLKYFKKRPSELWIDFEKGRRGLYNIKVI